MCNCIFYQFRTGEFSVEALTNLSNKCSEREIFWSSLEQQQKFTPLFWEYITINFCKTLGRNTLKSNAETNVKVSIVPYDVSYTFLKQPFAAYLSIAFLVEINVTLCIKFMVLYELAQNMKYQICRNSYYHKLWSNKKKQLTYKPLIPSSVMIPFRKSDQLYLFCPKSRN